MLNVLTTGKNICVQGGPQKEKILAKHAMNPEILTILGEKEFQVTVPRRNKIFNSSHEAELDLNAPLKPFFVESRAVLKCGVGVRSGFCGSWSLRLIVSSIKIFVAVSCSCNVPLANIFLPSTSNLQTEGVSWMGCISRLRSVHPAYRPQIRQPRQWHNVECKQSVMLTQCSPCNLHSCSKFTFFKSSSASSSFGGSGTSTMTLYAWLRMCWLSCVFASLSSSISLSLLWLFSRVLLVPLFLLYSWLHSLCALGVNSIEFHKTFRQDFYSSLVPRVGLL